MDIQAFIFNWNEHEDNAVALERRIGRLANVTVINSKASLESVHPHWVHLSEMAYFSAQWNKAVELFDAALFFHIQADARFDEFEKLFARATGVFEKYRVGVYEPNVDYTAFQYDTSLLRSVEPDIVEVPMTDCTCWFVEGSLLRRLPAIDVSLNRYGWGVCAAIAALSGLENQMCVRDYGLTVIHPRGRGYSSEIASKQRLAYISSLRPEVRVEVVKRYRELSRVMTPIMAQHGATAKPALDGS